MKMPFVEDSSAESEIVLRVNLGTVFADGHSPADYMPVLLDVVNFVPRLECLVGHSLSSSECARIEGNLRRQYRSLCPEASKEVSLVLTLSTDYRDKADREIHIRVMLKRFRSLKIYEARKKITVLEFVDSRGTPICSVQPLPFLIENFVELLTALRASFPDPAWDFFTVFLTGKWTAVGSPTDLPCVIPLLVTHDGLELAVRLDKKGEAVVAGRLVDGGEVSLVDLLPEIFKIIVPRALNRESMTDLADMIGAWGVRWERDGLAVRYPSDHRVFGVLGSCEQSYLGFD